MHSLQYLVCLCVVVCMQLSWHCRLRGGLGALSFNTWRLQREWCFTYSKKLHEEQSHTEACFTFRNFNFATLCCCSNLQEMAGRFAATASHQVQGGGERGGRGGRGQGGEGGSGAKWVILDGPLSPHKLETLLTLNDSDRLIKLSNGRGIPIDSSYRFILEVCHGLV